ncbi:MAG: alpha/beta hydrolase-fold protein [Pirellulales bacterium]
MPNMWTVAGVVLPAVLAGLGVLRGEVVVSPATRDVDGFLIHRVECEHQAAPTELRVLLPDALANSTADKPRSAKNEWPVVYLLPVEAGREKRFGDGIATVAAMDAANRYGAIIVQPTFTALPWYADHPTDRSLAQETYFVDVVVPSIEKLYPTIREPRGRLLVGFSKSGWGAWSLLLRHPEMFGKAASWDAPLMMSWPSKYGSQPIFGTEANFEKYRLTRLLDERADSLRSASAESPRLILLGRGNFNDHGPIHEQLDRLQIPHVYRNGPKTPHAWDKAWLEPCSTRS